MKKIGLFGLFLILFPLVVAGAQQGTPQRAQDTHTDVASIYPEITDQECDATTSCPEGLECYGFPGYGLRCAEPNPCKYWRCPPTTECAVAESYPGKIMCTRVCLSNQDCTATSESYVTSTGEVGTIRNQQRLTTISIYEKETGSGGILESSGFAVDYVNRLRLRQSKLYMETSAGEKEVNILPDEAVQVTDTIAIGTAVSEEIKSIELVEEKQVPVYSIKRERAAKVFGFIPAKMQIQTRVSAENGDLISETKPWWGFLAS